MTEYKEMTAGEVELGDGDTTNEVSEKRDYKQEKYVALYQARTILSKSGTMEERRICSKLLKKMKKEGIKSV